MVVDPGRYGSAKQEKTLHIRYRSTYNLASGGSPEAMRKKILRTMYICPTKFTLPLKGHGHEIRMG